MIREVVEDRDEETLRRLPDNRCKKAFLALFEKALDRGSENCCTAVKVMRQAAIKTFFTREADELADDKIYKLAKSQNPLEI